MYIYNSLTNQKEEFKTIEQNKVKMYVCGPTVYNYIHIGNARPVIFFDVVKRYLEHRGYEVTYVSNITDVDDKIIKSAIENNVDEQTISEQFKKAFLNDAKNLNCVDYDMNPCVTDYMQKIIGYIEKLEKLGYAYEVDGDVYFSVTKITSYGNLSNQKIENLEIGSRITNHNKKRNPLDFTLWKKTDVGIQWDSPWGKGRPGWHTECVAMINDTLGELIDIHGGGSDLKFPHHENEIAQSQAVSQTNLANYWVHNGRLMIDDEKMSKSLGNFIEIKDFLSRYNFRVLRLLMLSTHYRQPLNYTFENVENIKNDLEKLESSYKQLQYKLDLNNHLRSQWIKDAFSNNIIEEFNKAMDDDFNTANGITTLMSLVKEVNKIIRKSVYTSEELDHLLSLYYTFNLLLNIFGINFDVPKLNQEIKQLIKKREEARTNKDFVTSDAIREILLKKGINI